MSSSIPRYTYTRICDNAPLLNLDKNKLIGAFTRILRIATQAEKNIDMESDKNIIRGPQSLVPLPAKSVGEVLFEKLQEHVDSSSEALVDVVLKEAVSFKVVLERSTRLAVALQHFGLGPGDIAAISSENNIPFFYAAFGSFFVGATVAPINISYIKEELRHALGVLEPKILFCTKFTMANFLNVRNEFKSIQKIILIDSQEQFPGVKTLENFIKAYSGDGSIINFRPVRVDLQETATILFSSGTTGLAKGVMLSHENALVFFRAYSDERFVHQLGPGVNILGQLPLYHGYGLYVSLASFNSGAKFVIMKKFDFQLFLQIIQDYRISSLLIVPPIALALAKSPIVDKYDLSSIKSITCGAAPLPKQIEILIQKRLNIPLHQGYGLTEVTIASMTVPINTIRIGSVGKVWADMEAKIRDPDTGKSLGPNQVGEVCFRGKMVMKGYYSNEEATRSMLDKDGFLCTGDLAYYDEDEYFYVVDRLKELIKYKGFQVPPAELEAILTKHPQIMDAGVIGVPDEGAGELPLAFVVKVPGCNLTAQEVQDFVSEQVSHPKRLRGGVVFIAQIPKSPSGKILRKDLRNLLATLKSKL